MHIYTDSRGNRLAKFLGHATKRLVLYIYIYIIYTYTPPLLTHTRTHRFNRNWVREVSRARHWNGRPIYIHIYTILYVYDCPIYIYIHTILYIYTYIYKQGYIYICNISHTSSSPPTLPPHPLSLMHTDSWGDESAKFLGHATETLFLASWHHHQIAPYRWSQWGAPLAFALSLALSLSQSLSLSLHIYICNYTYICNALSLNQTIFLAS